MKKMLLFAILPFFLAGCAASQKPANGNLDHLNNRAMSNISALHDAAQDVSPKPLFKGTENTVAALQINKDGLLKEHITKVEALLVCVAGEVVYEDEKGRRQTLLNGDYIRIEPMVKHWVRGVQDSQLLLIK
jgi:quercetin dioxygenase-like cupin family protein